MSFETYHNIASGLLVIIAVTVLATLISLIMAIAGWRKPNRNRRLLLSFGLCVIAAMAIASGRIAFKFVHFPTELATENYEAIRDQMDTQASAASHILPGDTVPLFSVTTDAGPPFVLSKNKGSVVLVNFFRTDCGPCNLEMPALQRIWEEYGERGDFQLIAISRGETMDDIASYKLTHSITFPLATDADSSIYGQYASEGIPRTYLVSRDGKLLFQSLGFMQNADYDGDEKQIREMVASALTNHQ